MFGSTSKKLKGSLSYISSSFGSYAGASTNSYSKTLNNFVDLLSNTTQAPVLSTTTSAMSQADMQRVSNLTLQQRQRLQQYNAKLVTLLNELAALPQEEIQELEHSQHNNVDSIVGSLLANLNDIDNTELLDKKLDEVRGFMTRIKPKMIAQASRKQHVLLLLEKQTIRIGLLKQELAKFKDSIEHSQTFNDEVFRRIVNFETNIGQPLLKVSFLNAIISNYYVISTPPNFLGLQQSISQMFIVFAQLTVLGNMSIVHFDDNVPLVPPQIIWDTMQYAAFANAIDRVVGDTSNLAANILKDAGFSRSFTRNFVDHRLQEIFNMPIQVDFRSARFNAAAYNNEMNTAPRNPEFIFDNFMNNIQTASWSDIIKIASYIDPDLIQRISVLFKVPQERVVAALTKACADITTASNKMLVELKTAYRRFTPDILRKLQQWNSQFAEEAPQRRRISDGAIVTYVNLELLRINRHRYDQLAKMAKTTTLKLEDVDNRVARQEVVRNVRTIFGLLWQTVTLLEFIPLALEFFVPLKNMSRGNHFSALYTDLAKLAALRNSIIKSFWAGCNKSGMSAFIRIIPRLAHYVTSMYNFVAAFMTNIRNLRDTFIYRGSEMTLQPLRTLCQRVMLLMLTGQEHGDLNRVMAELNPNAEHEEGNVEEMAQSLGVEDTSDYNLNIF